MSFTYFIKGFVSCFRMTKGIFSHSTNRFNKPGIYWIWFILFHSIFVFTSVSQEHRQGLDTVFSFKPGQGQNNGQSPEYYPKNIFGLPTKTATEYIPASSPDDMLSLGLGGEIIVGFINYSIVDGDGPDFTVFENAFINPANNKIFAEPAKIAVSEDGINYFEFPFDSLTLQGCAGTKPTYGSKDTFNPSESGGNAFDLKDLGLSRINFIKITDICEKVLNNKNHPFYDAIITGFDLDAIVGLHLSPKVKGVNEEKSNENEQSLICNNGIININLQTETEQNLLKVYNTLGMEVFSRTLKNLDIVSLKNLPEGMYLVYLSTPRFKLLKKVIL